VTVKVLENILKTRGNSVSPASGARKFSSTCDYTSHKANKKSSSYGRHRAAQAIKANLVERRIFYCLCGWSTSVPTFWVRVPKRNRYIQYACEM